MTSYHSPVSRARLSRSCQTGSASRRLRFRATSFRNMSLTRSEMRWLSSSARRERANQVSSSRRMLRCLMGFGGTFAHVIGVGPDVATTVITASLPSGPTNGYPYAGCISSYMGIRLDPRSDDKKKPRPSLAAQTGLYTDEPWRTTVSNSLLVATKNAQGITYAPTCDAHRAPASFAIEFEDFDGEGRRELYCRDCIADGIDYTATSAWFTPPTISRITVPTPLAWRCARCDGDPDTCPVVNGRCVRELVA